MYHINTVRPELVEGLSFFSRGKKKERASTGSARTAWGNVARITATRFAAALTLLALVQPPAAAQPLELSVKAAFLPKFARYVTWPPLARPAPGAPVTVCVIGADPYGRLLDQAAAGEQGGAHPIQVRRLATTQGAQGCHVAFVRGTARQSTAQMLAALRALPVLTVTDSRYGGARGMIHFAVSGGKVSFHADDAAAARSSLAISSRLLRLALSVRQRA